jgi:hypothetical protein
MAFATRCLHREEDSQFMPSDSGPIDHHEDIVYPSAIPFVLVHLACFGAIWSGVTWESLILCVTLYWLRIFAIGAGYHRLFSHRAFSTSRAFRFVLAVLAQSTSQKSVLWWASKHRHHHLHSDTELDVHSPRHTGFLYSHLGWIFARRHESGVAVAAQIRAATGGPPRASVFPDRRLAGPVRRLLLEHGARLSRHVLHQLAGPCERPQALRDGR